MKHQIVHTKLSLYQFMLQTKTGKKFDWVEFPANTFSRLTLDDLEFVAFKLYAGIRLGFSCYNKFKDEKNKNARITLKDYWETFSHVGFTDRECTMDEWTKPFNNFYSEVKADPWERVFPANIFARQLSKYDVYAFLYDDGPSCFFDFMEKIPFRTQIGAIIEPMAGTAGFSFFSQYADPKLKVAMIDLDNGAKRWVEQNLSFSGLHKYITGSVTDHAPWTKAIDFVKTKKQVLGYLGRQSHHILDLEEILKLAENMMNNCDLIYIEGQSINPDASAWESNNEDREEAKELTHPVFKKYGYKIECKTNKKVKFNLLERLTDYEVHMVKINDPKERLIVSTVGGRTWTDYLGSTVIHAFKAIDPNVKCYYSDGGKFKPISECKYIAPDSEQEFSFLIDNRR